MPNDNEIKKLVDALNDCRTRSQARRQLERIGVAAAERLTELVGNDNAADNARWAAISLLGACRHRPAIPVLAQIVRDNATLKRDAVRALRAITGADHGEDASAWLAEADDTTPADAEKTAAETASAVTQTNAEESGAEDAERKEMVLTAKALGDVAERIAWEHPATVCVRIAPGGGKARDIRVSFDDEDRMGRPLARIHAEAGPATPTTQAVMFRHNVSLRYGNYETEKAPDGEGEHAVLRYRTDPETLTAPFLRDIVLGMANDLQQIEDELGQADRVYPWRATDPSQETG